MNWFSCFAQLQARPKTPTEYSQIGHRLPWQKDFNDCAEYLWIFLNGQVLYEEDVSGGKVHAQIWGEEAIQNYYSGRYDDCTNRISIGIPDKLQMRNVPNVLIHRLHQTFSPDAQIWSFKSGYGERGSNVDRVASSHGNWYDKICHNCVGQDEWGACLKEVHSRRDKMYLKAEGLAAQNGHVLTKWTPLHTAQCCRCGQTIRCNNIFYPTDADDVVGAALLNHCTSKLKNDKFVTDEQLKGMNERAINTVAKCNSCTRKSCEY